MPCIHTFLIVHVTMLGYLDIIKPNSHQVYHSILFIPYELF